MRLGERSSGRRVLVAAVALVTVLAVAPAVASGAGAARTPPRAGLSIDPGPHVLAVTLVAAATGFTTRLRSWRWVFGDGTSVTTKTANVTHTYRKAGRFQLSLTETDTQGQRATAVGTLELTACGAASTSCTVELQHVGVVTLLRLHGTRPIGVAATADLLVAPFRIVACEKTMAPAVGFTDGGFSSDITATLTYTAADPDNVSATCFSSTVAFVDAAGKRVHSGDLPRCAPPQLTETVPCVRSTSVRGTTVTKVLLVPPGDPKVGAPP